MKRIIGLWSPAPQSGKSTAAAILVDLLPGAKILPFADPLKMMGVTLLRQAGYSYFDATRHLFRDKEAVLELLPGKPTGRRLLQTLGTEWGRDCMGTEFWTVLWAQRAHKAVGEGWNVLVDDVRFPNEVQAVKDAGGEVWAVIRPGATDFSGHRSEQNLSALVSRVIRNVGTFDDLTAALRAGVEAMGVK